MQCNKRVLPTVYSSTCIQHMRINRRTYNLCTCRLSDLHVSCLLCPIFSVCVRVPSGTWMSSAYFCIYSLSCFMFLLCKIHGEIVHVLVQSPSHATCALQDGGNSDACVQSFNMLEHSYSMSWWHHVSFK